MLKDVFAHFGADLLRTIGCAEPALTTELTRTALAEAGRFVGDTGL